MRSTHPGLPGTRRGPRAVLRRPALRLVAAAVLVVQLMPAAAALRAAAPEDCCCPAGVCPCDHGAAAHAAPPERPDRRCASSLGPCRPDRHEAVTRSSEAVAPVAAALPLPDRPERALLPAPGRPGDRTNEVEPPPPRPGGR